MIAQDSAQVQKPSGVTLTDLLGAFFSLIMKSPPAIAVVGLSWFLGYGVSYMVLDYRRAGTPTQAARPTTVHVTLGMAYMAAVFIASNFDIMRRGITVDDLVSRLPFTGLLSFATALIVIVVVTLIRK